MPHGGAQGLGTAKAKARTRVEMGVRTWQRNKQQGLVKHHDGVELVLARGGQQTAIALDGLHELL